jgi:hypothetical protein
LPESILVERYVGEEEVAVEGVLRAGRLDVLAVFDKPDPLTGPYFEETIYVTPSRHPHGIVVAVGALTAAATSALGLTEGPVHAEVRFGGGGGGVYVIEVAARTIGGRCSRAVGFEGGRSLEDAVIGHALGRDDDRPGSWRAVGARGVMMIPIPASGILEAVEGVDRAEAVDGIDGVEITIPRGRPVRAIPEGDRYLGFVFASGDEPGVVEEALRRAFARLEIRVSPAAV